MRSLLQNTASLQSNDFVSQLGKGHVSLCNRDGNRRSRLLHRFCPFAQRTWVALNEKGIKYTLHEVAIKNPKTGLWHQLDEKPQWFLKLNPLGKVPTLAYKEDNTTLCVYESHICNEFLEDYQEKPSLFASHPVLKACERM